MTRDQLAGLVAAGRIAGSDMVSVAEGPWGPVAAYLGDGERSESGVREDDGDTNAARPAASGWYYSQGGMQLGPVPGDRLRALAGSGDLDPADLVWKGRDVGLEAGEHNQGAVPGKRCQVRRTSTPPSHAAPSSVGLAPTTTAEPHPIQPPQSDLFDRARSFSRKASAALSEAKAKAEAYQEEVRAKSAESQAILLGGAMAAADFARSDEAKELARKARV